MNFSVITPSFNQGRFIRDCIESVLMQQAAAPELEVEHIVIDACSTDETVSILKEYPHLTWVSEPDDGQTDAINKGFRRATGEWRMWLNADDFLFADAPAKVVGFAAGHPEAAVIYGDCDFVDESGKLIRRKAEFDFDPNMLLFYGCYIPSTACFYSRRIFDAGYELDPAFRVCMDFEWFLKLADAGFGFAHLPESLAGFRWHGENVSARLKVRRLEERLMLQRRHMTKQAIPLPQWKWFLRGMFYYFRGVRTVRRCLNGGKPA